jgi:hypothetical protein
MKFGFIAKHRGIWPVSWLCGALDVSRSGFHAWLVRAASARSRSDEVYAGKIREPMARVASGTISWPKAFHVACIVSNG